MQTNDRNRERLVALVNFVAALDNPTEGELDEHLRLEGMDPARAVERVLRRVEQATWLESAQEQRRSFVDSTAGAQRRASTKDRQQLLHLIRRQGARVSAQFRNVDKLSDEDLRQLVVDLGLLDGE
jgi:hypothetical protein